ncbi:Predicted SAM-depedendent methyltransferase [Marinilactibacillus piezotolerans]|uniref:Predicted SAM-depedendent methyltransferase n=1 Tax=Marinilactibacillus piezotolerans TaxID=258723 RepID=A0A1I3XWJ3_9LACT|nr:SAM-dependent methyltransferase [Marinilactibacillus piezotolerans]SFK23914.1 Predicted SAM-depedendent methyltransferase [Marinilactibacillus piezotolerans]
MRNMEKLRVVIGAGEYNNNPGWIHTQEQDLNVLEEASWDENFKIETIDVLLAEHVWEHFTYDEGVTAAKLCWKYLKPGGYFRCAVPDGYFPNKEYRKVVQVGGPGPVNHPAASHKTVYNFETLGKLFSEAGFECELLEYHDKNGVFHQINWNKEDGNIFRSVKVDPRNSSTITFPSLIIDAKKSLKVKFSSTV